nr:ATP-binding protein [Aestuariivivens insulae]
MIKKADFNNAQNPLPIKYAIPPTLNTITDVALVGGGAFPQPGEISLSHNAHISKAIQYRSLDRDGWLG